MVQCLVWLLDGTNYEVDINVSLISQFLLCIHHLLSRVSWHCWCGDSKSIRPVRRKSLHQQAPKFLLEDLAEIRPKVTVKVRTLDIAILFVNHHLRSAEIYDQCSPAISVLPAHPHVHPQSE